MSDRAETLLLGDDVGRWSGEVVLLGGSSEPIRGTLSARMVGGRWLVTDWVTETGDFQGHGVYGFDPQRGAYVGTWVDTVRTCLATGEGRWDEAARALVWRFRFELPGRGKVVQREVAARPSLDERVVRTFLSINNAPESESMVVTYRRLGPG